MAKKKEPKKVREKKEKPEKAPKMKSSAPRRFGAWVLVIFMLFTIGFGVFKIINSPTEVGITRAVEKQRTAFQEDTWARTKAVAFAERFAIAYFTNQEGQEYATKMSAFYAPSVIFTVPDVISETQYVGTSNVEIGEGGNVDVDVACKVAYTASNENSYDFVQFSTIRVPVHIDSKGNCAIVAPPIYVAESNNPSGSEAAMNKVNSGANVDGESDIKNTIENFFAVYYGGTASELKYYVTKNYGNADTVGQSMEVESVETTIEAQADYWEAECTIHIKNNGVTQEQHCFLQIVKGAEGRYYINKLSTTY